MTDTPELIERSIVFLGPVTLKGGKQGEAWVTLDDWQSGLTVEEIDKRRSFVAGTRKNIIGATYTSKCALDNDGRIATLAKMQRYNTAPGNTNTRNRLAVFGLTEYQQSGAVTCYFMRRLSPLGVDVRDLINRDAV